MALRYARLLMTLYKDIIQIWHLGECNINFYCTQKNDIARGACAECNIIFQSAIKIDIDTKPKCHICFIICLLLIQIKYLTNLKNYASQYQFCKVVMWPWSDQSQQRMSSRHIIIYKYGTWVSAISIFIALWKMILHEALAPSAISFFRVQ